MKKDKNIGGLPSELNTMLCQFGGKVLETLKTHIVDGMNEEDIEYAEMAVEIGLMKRELYDPEKHIDFFADEWGIEEGDEIYYWGN